MASPTASLPRCQNIATQSLALFNRLGRVQTGVVDIDERIGIVWLRTAWGARARRRPAHARQTFVYDGKTQGVEAFMRILPVEKRNGGRE